MQNNDSCILQCPTKLICLAVMQLLQEISSQYKALILSWRKEISLKKTARTFYRNTLKFNMARDTVLEKYPGLCIKTVAQKQ